MTEIPQRTAERSGTIVRGITIMTMAMLIVPSMDVLAKLLTRMMPALEVAFGRFVGQLVASIVVAIVVREGRRLIPPRLLGNMLRGLFLAATSVMFFSALATMPLTDALAIAFAEPMILTAVSPWLLGETVGWRRWAACGVGFLGTLMIIRPSFEQFGLTALLPLGAAFTFAGYHVMTRKLSGQGSLVAIQFVTGLVGTVALGLVLLTVSHLGLLSSPAVAPVGARLGVVLRHRGAVLRHPRDDRQSLRVRPRRGAGAVRLSGDRLGDDPVVPDLRRFPRRPDLGRHRLDHGLRPLHRPPRTPARPIPAIAADRVRAAIGRPLPGHTA